MNVFDAYDASRLSRRFNHYDYVAVARLMSGQVRASAIHPDDRDVAIVLMVEEGATAHAVSGRIGTGVETVLGALARDRERRDRLRERLVVPEIPVWARGLAS